LDQSIPPNVLPALNLLLLDTSMPTPHASLALVNSSRCFVLGMILSASATVGLAGTDRPGDVIFREQCAECHGGRGEGVATAAANPLIGDRSIGELARYIDATMPQGEPEALDAEDAQKVAAFIHEAFYSPTAQVRNQPPRIELSRLTVRQYQQTVTDLIEYFRYKNIIQEQGLKGGYFQTRDSRDEKRKIDRVDPTIQFQFGADGPDKAQIEPKEYFIRWVGSISAPVTGEYEFIIRSENGVRLWLNDQWGKTFLDAGVKSGSDTEFRASAILNGGRVYPLRIELYKAERETTGSIEFLWKRPHQQPEVVAARYLTTTPFPESFVLTTPFPPDDRSVGYERGTAVSKAWDEATTSAALEVSAYVLDGLRRLADVKEDDPERPQKLQKFCERFARQAFRRQLTDDEKAFFVHSQFTEGTRLEEAVQKSLILTLKSPYFLYRDLGKPTDPYSIAARMSYTLWDSIADTDLWTEASNNNLTSHDSLHWHTRRMSKDLRAEAKLREFFHQWLKLDHLHDLSKDTTAFPEFTAGVQSDLRTSLDLFIDEIVKNEQADFRQLVLSDGLYLNGRLAKFYGAELPIEADFQRVAFEPQSRAGVLSHPFLLSGFAYHSTSSPIHRGVWIARSLLGRSLRTPPVAVAPLPPDLHPDLTTRARVETQTSAAMCQSCHSLINPLGFGLEHFDAVGRYRAEEKAQGVNAQGVYVTRSGREVNFNGVRELAEFLAADPETHAAFTEQLFQYLVKQPIQAYGPHAKAELTQKFTDSGFKIRELQAEIATLVARGPAAPSP
jgi:cytochrome c553